MKTLVGYMREVKSGLALDTSRAKLLAAGVPSARIYAEEPGGEKTNLPTFGRALRSLRVGEVLVVPEVIQLAPNAKAFDAALVNIGERKAAVQFLDIGETIEDPGQHARVMARFRERSVRQRRVLTTAEARKMAKMRKRTGIDKKSPQYKADLAIWRNRDIETKAAAKAIGLCRSTCYKRYGERGVLEE